MRPPGMLLWLPRSCPILSAWVSSPCLPFPTLLTQISSLLSPHQCDQGLPSRAVLGRVPWPAPGDRAVGLRGAEQGCLGSET